MKILDRYILLNFLKNYAISFMVLVGLYIALDMVFNFADLVETPNAVKTHLGAVRVITDIAEYYAYQTPLIFAYLSGMIAVVGAAFTLLRMGRFNELTAILAAGVSLRRVSLPIILAGVGLNVLLLADHELLIPAIIPKLIRSHEEMHIPTPKSYVVEFMQDERNGLFHASRYTPNSPSAPPTVEYLDVVERDAAALPVGHLWAEKAVYDSSAHLWRLTNGKHVRILGPTDMRPEMPTDVDVYQSDITPDEIALWRGGQYVQLLPVWRIDQLIDRPKSYGRNELLRAKNMRYTEPLTNIVLLLLACPSLLSREPGQFKTAALRCLILCGLCMGMVFLSYQLGAHPMYAEWASIWPAAVAWSPIFVFGPVAVWLLDRIKT